MPLRRSWVVSCDAPGCEAVQVITADDKWDAGIAAVEEGWDAIPRSNDTFCLRHSHRRDDF